jgi:hypothetical protein
VAQGDPRMIAIEDLSGNVRHVPTEGCLPGPRAKQPNDVVPAANWSSSAREEITDGQLFVLAISEMFVPTWDPRQPSPNGSDLPG